MTSPPVKLSAGPAYRFEHPAMATTFELVIAEQEAGYAQQAAWAAFDEVDRLEQELSRFIPSSDVFRINAAGAGEMVRVGIATLECLELAAEIHAQTGGAFDVALGAMEGLEIDVENYSVGMRTAGARIDLGAVGKGYALDQIAGVLRDWSIDAALIHCGQSSVLAMEAAAGEAAWTVSLREPQDQETSLGAVRLRGRALSGSGMLLHGRHIVDPRTGSPARGKLATWAGAASAARSDALSTAFMVMTVEEVEEYCRHHIGISGMLLPESETPALLCFGPSEGLEVPGSGRAPEENRRGRPKNPVKGQV